MSEVLLRDVSNLMRSECCSVLWVERWWGDRAGIMQETH